MYGGASIIPEDYQDKGVPTVPKGSVNSSGIADLSGSKFVSENFYRKNTKSSVYSGDLVTSLRDLVPTAPNMGRIVKLIGDSKEYLIPQGVYRLLLEKGVDENFIIASSNSEKFRKIISQEKNGSTQVHIRNSEYLGIMLKAPNSEEQTIIGNFFKKIDNTLALHQRKWELLKQLKQAYLQVLFPIDGEKTPKIRFANFEENWEQRKVLDLSEETFGGGTPKTTNDEYWNGEIPWIQSSDLKEHDVTGAFVNKKITKKGLQNSATKLVPKNSIAIVTRVGVGKIALLQFEYATSQDFLSLAYLNVDKWFGVYSLYNLLQKEINNVQGTSIKGITKNELLEKIVCIPNNLDEQIKIGKFLINCDKLITLHQNKIHTLSKLKSLYLQKMFC